MNKKITFFVTTCMLCVLVFQIFNTKAQNWPPDDMEGDGLSEATAWQITTPEHLEILSNYVNDGYGNNTIGVYYKLMNNIDLVSFNWKPIGNGDSNGYGNNTYFRGFFNGNGKKINNLTINRPSEEYIGLFGLTYDALIHDLVMENCDIKGGYSVGGLVGNCSDGFIYNCYVSGNVNGYSRVGGLAGSIANSFISNCHVIGNVNGEEFGCAIGGLVGKTLYNSSISNCYTVSRLNGNCKIGGLVGDNNNSSISNSYANDSVSGNFEIGGLVGNNNNGSIYNCYALGNIIGNGDYIGGLVGQSYDNSTISNCFASGNVNYGCFDTGGLVGGNYYNSLITHCSATGNIRGESECGGLVGSNGYGSKISNCYATGKVYGYAWSGGLVGEQYNSTIFNCYATGDVDVMYNSSAGGLVGYQSKSFVSNCYASGNVIGESSVGGLVGGCSESTIINSVAANDSVISRQETGYINRIVGLYYIGSIIDNNYALNTMKVQNCNGDVAITEGDSDAGKGKSIEVLQSGDFYTTTGNWHNSETWDIDSVTAVWKICDGKGLPFLRWQEILCGNETTYIITATADPNGFLNPLGNVIIEEGLSKIFTFAANSNYEISQVLVDGINIPSAVISGEYIFENITADHTIHITFSIASIGENITKNMIVLYPNPTTGELRIENYELGITNIEVFDIYGRKLSSHHHPISSSNHVINISHFPAGIYIIKISTEEGEVLRKVVKE